MVRILTVMKPEHEKAMLAAGPGDRKGDIRDIIKDAKREFVQVGRNGVSS
jgi:hypothetical protein